MRLIVGLGNPGPEYAWTPHNLGFLTIDRLAEKLGIRVRRPEGRSLVGLGAMGGTEVALAKPQTFMNASGEAVRDLVARFAADPEEMIVITDDAALPWGALRIRARGSAGGHNGLKSVIGALGGDAFVRVRLGVGPAERPADLAEYVLRSMGSAERGCAAEEIERAVQAIEMILAKGTEAAMNRFNRQAPEPPEAEDRNDPGPPSSGRN